MLQLPTFARVETVAAVDGPIAAGDEWNAGGTTALITGRVIHLVASRGVRGEFLYADEAAIIARFGLIVSRNNVGMTICSAL